MLKVIVFILYITYSSFSINFENCFYHQSVTYVNNYAYSTLPTGYTMQAVWDTEQIGIVKYSYFLSGFQIAQLPNPILTFDASITNVTSTSGTFTFNPYNNSAIYYISFTIILLKTTTGIVELQYLEHNTNFFNDPSRVSDIENLNIYISTTFKTNFNNYKWTAFLSSFQIVSALNIFEMEVALFNPIINNSFQTIQFLSYVSSKNIFLKICLTYVMFDIYSFNNTIVFYRQSQTINTNYQAIIVPAQFQPNAARKCLFGISKMKTNFITRSVSTVIYLQGSNSVNFMNSDDNIYRKFCIQSCPSNHFANYAISEADCYPCEYYILNCYSCSSLAVCQQCVEDYFLMYSTMKCHRICPDGFYGNTTTLKCETCSNSTVYVMMANGSCDCQAGYRMLNSICTNLTGCLSLVYESYVAVCKFCSLAEGFETVNGSCQCTTGFSFLGTTCSEICGDGMLFRLACDDGNTQSGDGCSSACQLEQNYACTQGSSSNASVCAYLKQDIILSLKRIEKADLADTGIFTFQLSPVIYSMNRLNLTRDVSFLCVPNKAISSMSLSNGLLVIFVDFSEDLEGREANVTLLLQSIYFLQSQAKTSFPMVSNGVKLLVTKNRAKMLMCKESIEAISLVTMILFFLASLTHKMTGVEMIHSFQVIYLVHLLNSDYTQLYSFLRLFSFSAFDFLMVKENLSGIVSAHTKIAFGEANLELSITLIVGVSVASLFVFMTLSLLWSISLEHTEKFQQNHSKQLFDLLLVSKYSYNHLLFPFVISTLLVPFVVLNSKNMKSVPIRFAYSFIFQILLLSAVFFYEFKTMFIDHSRKQALLGVTHCKRQYISYYLLFSLAVAIVLSLSFQSKRLPVQFILVGIYGCFLLYLIISRPYSSNVHNIGAITNVLLLIYFLIWSGLKSNKLISQSEDNQLLALFLFILLSIVAVLATLSRIMYEGLKVATIIRQKCLSKNKIEDITLIQRQQLDNVEANQEEFMKEIAKANLKDTRDIDPSLFIHAKDRVKDSTKEFLKKNLRARLKERQAAMSNRDSLL